MWAFFIIVLAVPLVAIIAAYIILHTVTWQEVLAQVAVAAVIAGCSAGIVSCANTADTEALNGHVVGKERVEVSCSHSYSCRCRDSCSGSGKNRSCTRVCDTCYHHSYDVDWRVQFSAGGGTEIDRVDWQGTSQPPRWASIQIGEPTSVAHSYTNYVKAAPDTLFRRQGLDGKYVIPDYPGRFYDYYRLDHFTSEGIAFDTKAWNEDLAKLNDELGASKQVNIVVVMTVNKPREWFYALEQYWIGGKKNDAILVVSVDSDYKPQWVEVMAWVTDQAFKVRLKSAIMEREKITREDTIADLRSTVSTYYKRKPMADFEYLSSSVTPSMFQWVLTLIINLLAAVGTIIVAHRHDFSSDYRQRLRARSIYSQYRF